VSLSFFRFALKFSHAPTLAFSAHLIIGLLANTADAQQTSTSIEGLPGVNQNSASLPPAMTGTSETKVNGYARTEGAYFPSAIPGNSALSQSIQGEVNLKIDHESVYNTTKVDGSVGDYVNWDSPYYSIQQLYSGVKLANDSVEITAGRRIEFWSGVDKDWQLGLWEPQFSLDPLEQVDQGLTGVFYQQRVTSSAGTFDWVTFGSMWFIPTTQPNIQEQNGSLVSENRWYQQPTSSGVVQGQPTQFMYSLNIPPVDQLINNPGGGLRLRWGQNVNQTGLWSSVNYAYKPVNELIVKYDANLMVSGGTSQIDIVPAVAYAHLLGGDVGYKSASLGNFSFSYLEEDPIQQTPSNSIEANSGAMSDWWQQQLGQLHIYSLHWDSNFKVVGIKEKVELAFDYLRVFENNTEDIDSTGVVHSSILPYQTLYTNAVSAKVKMMTYLGRKKLTTKFKAIRDFDQKGNVYQTEFDLAWTAKLTLNTGLDVISPDDPSAANQEPGFINEFRTNDRVYVGCNYVF
jgi:hypothetical protein